ncbi:hypothetical protein WJX72_009038 [[Myrmecia] bisecta]|uniref:Uncharacterized protein n=1 Tax=[Myrmecia] bisecta TaxID=41462 RepID=A0AAW1P4Q8_9CHLO
MLPRPKAPRKKPGLSRLIWLFVLVSASFGLVAVAKFALQDHSTSGLKTLVVYVFRNTDPEAVSNLNYFLQNGVAAHDGAQYIIAIESEIESDSLQLPALPTNAQFARPGLVCFETGIVGWVLYDSGLVDVAKFTYVVWLNSSVRGPFLPVYLDPALRWHQLLTSRLVGGVKLVGATISCAGLKVNPAHGLLQLPHVQDSLVATDRVGLRLLREAHVFDCHTKWLDNLRFAEYGASEAVLQAGYNLDSLMLRYAGVDWQDRSKWGCGAMLNPQQDGLYDGIALNPLEVMFVRVQQPLVVGEWVSAKQATKYHEWTRADRSPEATDITSNEWGALYAKQIKQMRERGSACFDSDFYINAAPVEFAGYTPQQAYDHFIANGFKEGRPFQFTC